MLGLRSLNWMLNGRGDRVPAENSSSEEKLIFVHFTFDSGRIKPMCLGKVARTWYSNQTFNMPKESNRADLRNELFPASFR